MGGKARFLGALIGAGGLAACTSSEGVPISPGKFEGNTTVQTLSGVGIIPRRKEQIDYRPRSPLVLPAQYALREPEPSQMAEAVNPAWPKDPEIERRRRAKEFAELPLDEWRRRRGISDNSRDLLLTAEEMEKGRKPGAGLVTEPPPDPQRVWLLPSEYQRKPTAEELEEKALDSQGTEPRRKYLTEPPTGYRVPVPATTPEGQAAAEKALKARQEKKGERRSLLSFLGL